MGALGAKALSQFEFLPGAPLECEGSQGFGGGEIERGAKRRGGMAKQPALESRRQFCEAHDVESQAIGCGPSAAAHGTAGQNELRRERVDLGLPPGFFVARQLGHVCEVLAQARVPGLQSGSSSWRMRLRVKVRWRLEESSRQLWFRCAEIGFDFGAGGRKERAKMRPSGKSRTGWMPERPSVHAPRRNLARTVSAWSSRV